MASSSSSLKKRIAFAHITILIILLAAPTKLHAIANCFKSIISFGDSFADTGNRLHLSLPSNTPPYIALLPYGETFFHHPTGRYSDGRLIIDFISQHLGLPFIPPFFSGKNLSSRDFRCGVNFAVGGATALLDSSFANKGVETDMSLMAQLSWFKEIFLPAFCQSTADCESFLETSLVLVGEIGGNDYNYPFFHGKSVDFIQSTFIPKVVKTISSTVKELIKLGAVTLMVPGNLPIGCSATYLTIFRSSNQTYYDPKTGCLNWLNRFSQHHNKVLQLELDSIREQNPNINIIYADYYNVAMQIYRSPEKCGFAKGALSACCGGGGPYNVNLTLRCGYGETETCDDPSLYVSWDGLHLTEAPYRVIAKGLLQGPFTIPQFNSVCSSSSNKAAAYSDH